jgi:hypothetical protein
MKKLEPIQLIDEVLNFIKTGEHWKTLSVIHAHFRGVNIELQNDDLYRILLKLMDDNYVEYSEVDDYRKDHYMATYNGILFLGYVKQREIDDLNNVISDLNKKRIIRNEKLLVSGTWSAGIAAALLLLWQVWIWFYPIHNDYPYWIWETIPKKP